MKIGFTGTQKGMTAPQSSAFTSLLPSDTVEFHHGDCIGADSQAASIAKRAGIKVVAHPPVVERKRAFFPSDAYLLPKDYLLRNYDIVDASDIMFATPRKMEEELRSGTWSTIRYARRRLKPLIVIWPNGDTSFENGVAELLRSRVKPSEATRSDPQHLQHQLKQVQTKE